MSTAEHFDLVSVESYLKAEETSETRHEYLGGVLYAMNGGRNVHNLIATNLTASLWNKLRGSRCQAYNSDTKIRIRAADHTRFYYPDASVICKPGPPDALFQDHPFLVAEVLSESTRRADSGEKREAYLSIPSLEIYLMAEQDTPVVIVYRRRENGFQREVISGLKAGIPLPELNTELPLAELYQGVEFSEVNN